MSHPPSGDERFQKRNLPDSCILDNSVCKSQLRPFHGNPPLNDFLGTIHYPKRSPVNQTGLSAPSLIHDLESGPSFRAPLRIACV
jgi:hypothetical protein